MSDIRLNTLKYTPLPSDDDTRPPMRASVRAAATASTSRLAKKAGKRPDRYTDDPEEEAGLLADETYEEEQAYEEAERRLEAEIETVCPFLFNACAAHPLASNQSVADFSRAAPRRPRIHRERYPFDRLVRSHPPASRSPR